MNKSKIFLCGATSCGSMISDELFDIDVIGTVSYRGGNLSKSFDTIVLFDTKLPDHLRMFDDDIRIIGIDRFTKSEQVILMDRFEINHPSTFAIFDMGLRTFTIEQMDGLLATYDYERQLVIKPNRGARGIGQLLTSRKDFKKYYEETMFTDVDSSNRIDGEKIEKALEFNKENRKYNNYLVNAFKSADICIQEFVEVVDEWRVIMFHGEQPIICHRIKSDKSWQSNLAAHNENRQQYLKGQTLLDISDIDFYNKICSLFKSLNTPFLSIDIYKDSEGKFGLFEFQMEFGYMSIPNDTVYQRINYSIMNMINEHTATSDKPAIHRSSK